MELRRRYPSCNNDRRSKSCSGDFSFVIHEVEVHEYTIEYLYHFNCVQCKNWWSFASTTNGISPTTRLHCPLCGHHDFVKQKDGLDFLHEEEYLWRKLQTKVRSTPRRCKRNIWNRESKTISHQDQDGLLALIIEQLSRIKRANQLYFYGFSFSFCYSGALFTRLGRVTSTTLSQVEITIRGKRDKGIWKNWVEI